MVTAIAKKYGSRGFGILGTVVGAYAAGLIEPHAWPAAVAIGIGMAGFFARDCVHIWRTGAGAPIAPAAAPEPDASARGD